MDWEWKPTSEESSKSVEFPSVVPTDANTYGGRYVYDDEEPLLVFQFRGVNVPKAQTNLIRAAYFSKKTKYSLTDKLGDSHQGYVTSFRFENIDGCDRYNVDLSLTKVVTELGA